MKIKSPTRHLTAWSINSH